jgi:hypothetical protein
MEEDDEVVVDGSRAGPAGGAEAQGGFEPGVGNFMKKLFRPKFRD